MALYILEHDREIQHRTCLFQAGKDLSVIPDEWYVDSGPMAVERVSLSRNKLKELSRPLKAPMLKVLLLNQNDELGRIRSVFLSEFKNLRVLDLSRTGIETLPKAVSNLANLVVLDLSGCTDLRSIAGAKGIVRKLVKLEYINMGGCQNLQSFPIDQLGNLVRMRHLSSTMCGKGFQLESAAGSKIHRHCVPRFFKHARLRNLYPSLPVSMQSLSALQTLSLYHCHSLQELPDWLLTSLPRLVTLVLIHCSSLRRLPTDLGRLKVLVLTGCSKLSSIPEEWGEPDSFPCLDMLQLYGWQLLDRLPEFQPGAMRRLSSLNCENCGNLQRVPESISVLTNLNILSFERCKNVKEIPETLLSLENLRELSLSGSGITTLPAGIARLPMLTHLSLNDCEHLEMLPAEWEDGEDLFPRLEYVGLGGSAVKKLARGIATAPKLRQINVEGCREELYEPELFSVLEIRKLVELRGWPPKYRFSGKWKDS